MIYLAGFVFGSGLLFPGTYKRKESILRGAKDGVKIIIGLVPVFIVAAFFETFITQLMSQTVDKQNNGGMPVWVSILILTSSLAFIIYYFVIICYYVFIILLLFCYYLLFYYYFIIILLLFYFYVCLI